MANQQNLKSWKPGQSGNPAGKPKGTKHLSTWIREMLEDDSFTAKLASGKTAKGAPVKAIIQSLAVKALEGDMKAFDLLAKYGYGTKVDATSKDQPLNFNNGVDRFINRDDQLAYDPVSDRLDEIPR
jgi:hypothetical protein